MKKGSFKQAERVMFYLLCLANLIPLFTLDAIQSLDGPAHLYNARIVAELFQHPEGFLSNYFQFNPWNLTNWTGHILLVMMHWIFPAQIAEKILGGLLLFLFPLVFRVFVMGFKNADPWLTWLIFPFVWSQFMFHGFYNFTIGLIFGLVFLKLWMQTTPTLRFRTFWLILTASLCGLSHIFPFMIIMAVAGTYTLWRVFQKHNGVLPITTHKVKHLLQQLLMLFVICIPGLVILGMYLFSPLPDAAESLPTGASALEIGNGIRTIRPIIGLVQGEQMFTVKLFYLLVLMGIAAFLIRGVSNRRDHAFSKARYAGRASWWKEGDFLLWAVAGFLLAYVVIFRWFENGKYVHDRILFVGFLLYVAWLCMQKFPRWFSKVAVALTLICCVGLMTLRYPLMKMQQSIQGDFLAMAKAVPQDCIIFPVNFSGNWMHSHAPDYMGAAKPVVILENYECDQKYFPLQWTAKAKSLGSIAGSEYPRVWNVDAQGIKTFDFLLTYAEIDAADRLDYIKFRLWVNKRYRLVAASQSDLVRLYEPL